MVVRKKNKGKNREGSFQLNSIDPLDELLGLSDEDTFDEDSFMNALESSSDDDYQETSSSLDDFDISKIIEEEIESFRPISRDLKIDDSKIPVAKNFYQFTMGEEFLNSPPYLEQALIGLKFFSEYCPTCSDLEWMHDDGHEADEGLHTLESKVVMLEHGVCPKCGARKSHLIRDKKLNFYNELAINAGQRSGKSAVTTMIAAYVLHRYLMIGKPTELLGIRSNEVLHGTFLALTLGQAKENLWDPFYGYLTESPWFRTYHKMLRHYERKYGEQLLNLKDTFVKYRHRNMLWYPATPDKRTLRGRTRIFGAIDELGWFDANRDTNKVKDNAHEVYKAASNSLATARQSEERLIRMELDIPLTGYMVNVSSPSSVRDKITELVRQSEGSTKLLGLHKPTWKMNPHLPRNSPIIVEEFRKDPIGASRDFGAEPSLSAHPFISNTLAIENAVRPIGTNWVQYRLGIENYGRGKEAKRYRTASILRVKKDKYNSIMAIDAGLTNNCFALAIGSMRDDGEAHIDCLIEINPMPGVPVSHTIIYRDIILPLIEARNVKILLADRWNSVKLLEDALRDSEGDLKISKQYSLKYVDMYAAKDAIELGTFKIPRSEKTTIKDILDHDPDDYPKCFEGRPVEHLMLQLATIQDAAKKQVLKGDGFTDDLWRASALCHWGLTNPEFAEVMAEAPPAAKPMTAFIHMKKLSSNPGGVRVGGGTMNAQSSGKTLGIKKSMKST